MSVDAPGSTTPRSATPGLRRSGACHRLHRGPRDDGTSPLVVAGVAAQDFGVARRALSTAELKSPRASGLSISGEPERLDAAGLIETRSRPLGL